jgi:arginine/lysine/ornithine decarboxylase
VSGGRLVAALHRAVETASVEERDPERERFAPPPPWGELAMTPRQAFLGPQEVIPFDAAVGRIAAEGLAAYPPGIPNVLPGERLTAETLDYIRASVAHGGYVRGGSDRKLQTLRVSR